jgi:hypothetical protein
MHVRPFVIFSASLLLASCGSSGPKTTEPTPNGTELVRETLTGSIGASSSPACPNAFQRSVDASYYAGGTQKCVEFARSSTTGGGILARLTWEDVRLDLDLVLNDTVATNYRQSIAANRCCETIEFAINPGTRYSFVVYLRGVDAQFLANGGRFSGEVTTRFTLVVERPK